MYTDSSAMAEYYKLIFLGEENLVAVGYEETNDVQRWQTYQAVYELDHGIPYVDLGYFNFGTILTFSQQWKRGSLNLTVVFITHVINCCVKFMPFQ